jgi:hypothetical protein
MEAGGQRKHLTTDRLQIRAALMWEPDVPTEPTFRQWVRDAWPGLRPFSTGGNYVNF